MPIEQQNEKLAPRQTGASAGRSAERRRHRPSFAALRRIRKSLVRNLLQAIPALFVIVTLSFFLLRLAPGDAADYIAAESGAATVEGTAAIRQAFGLDLPLLDQLLAYYSNLLHGSLGISPRFGIPVSELIAERLPNTLLLMITAITAAILLGVIAGTAMGLRPGGPLDRALSVASLLFYSVPAFWIGLMLIVAFSVKLGWLPSSGARTIGSRATGFGFLLERARYLVLPATSLALYYVAIYARLMRAAVIEVSVQDHVRTAVAKGISPLAVIIRHVVRNALIPLSTLAGMHVAGMLGGAVVIETVFGWPGMGRLAYDAVVAREYTLLLGIMLTCAVTVLVANALVDILQAMLDPRIEVR